MSLPLVIELISVEIIIGLIRTKRFFEVNALILFIAFCCAVNRHQTYLCNKSFPYEETLKAVFEDFANSGTD